MEPRFRHRRELRQKQNIGINRITEVKNALLMQSNYKCSEIEESIQFLILIF